MDQPEELYSIDQSLRVMRTIGREYDGAELPPNRETGLQSEINSAVVAIHSIAENYNLEEAIDMSSMPEEPSVETIALTESGHLDKSKLDEFINTIEAYKKSIETITRELDFGFQL